MQLCVSVRLDLLLLLTLALASAAAAFAPSQLHHQGHHTSTGPACTARNVGIALAMADNGDDEKTESSQEKPASDRYDVSKLVGGEDGEGFNQFDPVLSATGFLSRRFGIAGGLAIFAALAFVEGNEIVKGFGDASPDQGSGETITTPSGLKITELLIGKGGSAPLPGFIIGLRATVKIGDKVIYQTTEGEKPVAFKYGQRPFQNVICEGVEEGIKGMKVGGKRILEVPANLAPPGVDIPPGVSLTYEIELAEVLSSYF